MHEGVVGAGSDGAQVKGRVERKTNFVGECTIVGAHESLPHISSSRYLRFQRLEVLLLMLFQDLSVQLSACLKSELAMILVLGQDVGVL